MQTWNVRVGYEQTDPIDLDRLQDVLEILDEHSAVASSLGHAANIALFVDAATLTDAIDQAIRLVADATAGPEGFVVVAIEAKTEEAFMAEVAEPPFPPMVGYTEIAEMLGVSRQRVHQLAAKDGFPAPVIETRQGPLMLEAAVTEWMRRHRPAR